MRRLFGCPDIVSLTEKFLMARNFFRIFTENNPVMGDSKTFCIPEAKGLTSRFCKANGLQILPCMTEGLDSYKEDMVQWAPWMDHLYLVMAVKERKSLSVQFAVTLCGLNESLSEIVVLIIIVYQTCQHLNPGIRDTLGWGSRGPPRPPDGGATQAPWRGTRGQRPRKLTKLHNYQGHLRA